MNASVKPFAESCEQNKEPILAVLRDVFVEPATVLEIGSGTGQHAVYFARQLPHLQWQPTDQAEYLDGIRAWVRDDGPANVHAPLRLDVARQPWPVTEARAVFSANTVHIMSWPQVEDLFQGLGTIMAPGAPFCLYGPFNQAGRYTSESNRRFDQWLRARDSASGVRDRTDLEALGAAAGLVLEQGVPMPANNFTLVWRKR